MCVYFQTSLRKTDIMLSPLYVAIATAPSSGHVLSISLQKSAGTPSVVVPLTQICRKLLSLFMCLLPNEIHSLHNLHINYYITGREIIA